MTDLRKLFGLDLIEDPDTALLRYRAALPEVLRDMADKGYSEIHLVLSPPMAVLLARDLELAFRANPLLPDQSRIEEQRPSPN